MQSYTRTQTSLTKENKTAVGLLSIGTFLEYFDLMLYVHMAVLLNEIFFPKTDPAIKSILTASVFCSTYIVRPLGSLAFGWIGDNIGRKVSLIITTVMMSICCLTMSVLPTYAEIGITASILVTICRIVQGMSSMGEIVGAQIYLTESIKVPARYPAVGFICAASSLGGFGALGIASLVFINPNLSWRYAFLLGALVACVGWVARSALRETSEFADAKKRHRNILAKAGLKEQSEPYQIVSNIKINRKTILSLFSLDCMWPICFYFTYIYCSEILQNNFHYSPQEVIHNNFIVSLFQILMHFTFIILSFRIHPLKIVQAKILILSLLFLLFPFWSNSASSGSDILIFQCLVVFFAPGTGNAVSSLYNHFATLKRFTYASVLYALSRAIVYVLTSFGFIAINHLMGHWGICLVVLLMLLICAWASNHFVILEKQLGHAYPFVRRKTSVVEQRKTSSTTEEPILS